MRKMKDSGIAWIGEIPEEWKVSRVKRLFTIGRGRVIATTELKNEGYPVYSSQTKNNGILGYIDTFDFDRSQLTWTTDGANAGTVFLREGKHNCTNVCGTLTPKKDDNDLKYLCYTLAFIAFYHKRADINGFKIMNNEMAEIEIILPPLDEQRRIAAFLDEKCAHIDAVIAKTRASIDEYKKLKQAIITRAVTKGLRQGRKMKDSGIEWIGEIPEAWTILKTKSLSRKIVVGVVIKPADYFNENGTVPFLRGINVKEYTIQAEPMVYIDEKTNRLLAKSIVHTDDLLIVRDGSIGTSCVVPSDYDGANVVSMIIVTCNESILPKFLCYSFNSDIGKTQFSLTKIGTALTHTSVHAVSNIFHFLPQIEEQLEIAAYLDAKTAAIDRLIAKKEQLIAEMQSCKKSLIYEVVTGKREVH